ncbi:MAG: PDZ domain-containing protein [Planctomycetota bacterium]
MRVAWILLPLALALSALAEEAATPEELVKKLGADAYEVRERATRDLIALGQKAVPALERALDSEDLEVRLRAGRALRAIRSGGRRAEGVEPEAEAEAPQDPESQLRPGTSLRGVEVQILPGKVRVKVRTVENGDEKVDTYEGKSLEELKRTHPELRKALGGLRFRTGERPDRDRRGDFWRDWSRDFDQDFWKRWREEQREWLERMRRLQRRFQEDREPPRPSRRPGGTILGVEVQPVDGVVKAQLDLADGLVILRVQPGSRAERLGLRRYDVLLSLDGRTLRTAQDLRRVLRGLDEGAGIRAVVVRRARHVELSTPPRERVK